MKQRLGLLRNLVSFMYDISRISNQKTSYYGLIGLDGDGSAQNIVKSLVRLWEQDGINPINTCWIASDNASTFTGMRDSILFEILL